MPFWPNIPYEVLRFQLKFQVSDSFLPVGCVSIALSFQSPNLMILTRLVCIALEVISPNRKHYKPIQEIASNHLSTVCSDQCQESCSCQRVHIASKWWGKQFLAVTLLLSHLPCLCVSREIFREGSLGQYPMTEPANECQLWSLMSGITNCCIKCNMM